MTEEEAKEELEKLSQMFPDGRKRGSAFAPPDVVVGSPEYWRLWKERNKERNRLYQKRSYLRRKKLTLALQKYEDHSQTTIAQALAEVEAELAQLKELRPSQVAETRIATRGVGEPLEEFEVPFIRDMAEKYGLSYKAAQEMMSRESYRGEVEFEELMALRLKDILGSFPSSSGEE